MSTTTRRRVARKHRECGCDRIIGRGEVYLEHKVFPGDDVYIVEVPVRLAECSACATRYGRAELLAQS